jgi:drug/metabolite transporter (DMT)-like permease
MIFVLFKLFDKYRLSTLQAIIINYGVAALFGAFLLPDPGALLLVFTKTWIWVSVLMGFMFISLFYLMAYISQRIGLSVASVATKMSVIIPVTAAIFLYGDSITWLKSIGIVLALAGIWMATMRGGAKKNSTRLFWLPVLLFVGSGALDTLLKLAENRFVPSEDAMEFIPSIFLLAFLWGLIIQTVMKSDTTSDSPAYRSWAGGALLGVVNYGSIFFIWKALSGQGVESSVVFPLANMGVVAASTLAGYLLFNEQLSLKNWMGIVISVVAIAIMTMT